MRDDEELATIATVHVSFDDDTTGVRTNIVLTYEQLLPIVRMLHEHGQRGLEDIFQLLVLGGTLAIQLRQSTEELKTAPDRLTKDEKDRMGSLLYRLRDVIQAKFKNDEDAVIEATYVGLRNNACTRAEAALFASAMLGRNFSSDAWRKKVDRWVAQQGLPKVDIYKKHERANRTDNEG